MKPNTVFLLLLHPFSAFTVLLEEWHSLPLDTFDTTLVMSPINHNNLVKVKGHNSIHHYYYGPSCRIYYVL